MKGAPRNIRSDDVGGLQQLLHTATSSSLADLDVVTEDEDLDALEMLGEDAEDENLDAPEMPGEDADDMPGGDAAQDANDMPGQDAYEMLGENGNPWSADGSM